MRRATDALERAALVGAQEGAVPLIYDLDIAGVVTGSHGWFRRVLNESFIPSKGRTEIEGDRPGAAHASAVLTRRARRRPRGCRVAAPEGDRREFPPCLIAKYTMRDYAR